MTIYTIKTNIHNRLSGLPKLKKNTTGFWLYTNPLTHYPLEHQAARDSMHNGTQLVTYLQNINLEEGCRGEKKSRAHRIFTVYLLLNLAHHMTYKNLNIYHNFTSSQTYHLTFLNIWTHHNLSHFPNKSLISHLYFQTYCHWVAYSQFCGLWVITTEPLPDYPNYTHTFGESAW